MINDTLSAIKRVSGYAGRLFRIKHRVPVKAGEGAYHAYEYSFPGIVYSDPGGGFGAALAASTEQISGLSAGSPVEEGQERERFAWEKNLKDNVAARSMIEEQITGIPYGVDVPGVPGLKDRW